MARSKTEPSVAGAGALCIVHHSPILVCGAPRTGTSWTAKALSRAGNVRYMREPLSHGGYAAGEGFVGYPYLEAGDDAPDYERVWKKVLSFNPLLARRWLTAQSRTWLQRSPFWPARLLVKEVDCPLTLDWLAARFPMTFVITIRHPCGYIASGLRLRAVGHDVVDLDQLLLQPRLLAGLTGIDGDWLSNLKDPIARMAAAYGIVYKLISEQRRNHPEWILVHHESLCEDPRRGFRDLCKAVNLSYGRTIEQFLDSSTETHDEALYSLNRVSARQPDKWKSELSVPQIKAIAAVIARFDLPYYPEFV